MKKAFAAIKQTEHNQENFKPENNNKSRFAEKSCGICEQLIIMRLYGIPYFVKVIRTHCAVQCIPRIINYLESSVAAIIYSCHVVEQAKQRLFLDYWRQNNEKRRLTDNHRRHLLPPFLSKCVNKVDRYYTANYIRIVNKAGTITCLFDTFIVVVNVVANIKT